jgi:hypothetical protein
MSTIAPPPLPSTPASPQRHGWWQRHWKWAAPLLTLTLLAFFAGAIFAFVWWIMSLMRDNDVYRIAFAQARADKTVIATLGTPIEAGWMVTGRMNKGADGGYASYEIPVEGPRGEASVFAVAHRRLGVWKFETLAVTPEGSDTPLDLTPSLPAERKLTPEELDEIKTQSDYDEEF